MTKDLRPMTAHSSDGRLTVEFIPGEIPRFADYMVPPVGSLPRGNMTFKREFILELREDGHTYEQIAEIAGVSKITAYNYCNGG